MAVQIKPSEALKYCFNNIINNNLNNSIKITADGENKNVSPAYETTTGYFAGVSFTKEAKDMNFDLDLMYGNEDGLINQVAAISLTKSFGKTGETKIRSENNKSEETKIIASSIIKATKQITRKFTYRLMNDHIWQSVSPVPPNKISYFKEKSSLDEGWINGGFFVMESKFLKFINNDKTFLERVPFEKLTKKKQLVGFKHSGFWQCMDTLRDKEILEKKVKEKKNLE